MARPPLPPSKALAGWREWVGLPDLGVARIKAKLDTGARTSAIHAWNIVLEGQETADAWIRFDLHPLQRDNSLVVPCRARLVDIRDIRNSGGDRERRYVIRTCLALGGATWPIELSLTNRDQMGFRLLIGRAAVRDHLIVDPGRSFVLGPKRPSHTARRRSRRPHRIAP